MELRNFYTNEYEFILEIVNGYKTYYVRKNYPYLKNNILEKCDYDTWHFENPAIDAVVSDFINKVKILDIEIRYWGVIKVTVEYNDIVKTFEFEGLDFITEGNVLVEPFDGYINDYVNAILK